ncbi:MAG: U32 family peptidase [Rickettsiales bacterium]|jgi:putative protease|nr:U32 family peptidase [Rickettsiales bacterium]
MKLELLAPAKDKECALAAINFGADAIYIGAPKFGARQAAGNSLDDIREIVAAAHKFYVRVYAAVNTILTDAEIPEARKIIKELAAAGVDALIVQDMAIFEMAHADPSFPKIPLFASTQCDNRSAEKVKWLEDIGAARVILARELSLEQIAAIGKAAPEIELESFIHGALCVSYSGQCYLSEYCAGRSANRGACAQMCRMKYTLTDDKGETVAENKHLLCLKDFNASEKLQGLADAGVSSFKIEGRLKDANYVKNVVAFYRQKIDAFAKKTSSGIVEFDFTPDPAKSFNRGFTEYFLDGKRSEIWNFKTPKHIGEPVGKVLKSGRAFFEYEGEPLHAQDGLCFFDGEELKGFLVNKVEGTRVFARNMDGLRPGMKLFRNVDAEFEKQLATSKSRRRIQASIKITDEALTATDEDGNIATLSLAPHEPATNIEKMRETFNTQLKKSGDSDFAINNVELNFSVATPFFTLAELNALRRDALAKLMEERLKNRPHIAPREIKPAPFPYKTLDYRANVYNSLARKFYESCSAKVLENAFEKDRKGRTLMCTKHCIKHALGMCKSPRNLTLVSDRGDKFPLEFDCKKCEMTVLAPTLKG